MTTFDFLKGWLQARFGDTERGAAMVEYGLLVALIAVVAIGAVILLGQDVDETFSSVADQLPAG
ncbi:MAG: Flp family type IVb pilin [Acidimicrobiales bacterium]